MARLLSAPVISNWRSVFEETVQVDYASIPNGQFADIKDEDGIVRRQAVTVPTLSLGFQTEIGRGKGVQWVPVTEIDSVMDRLVHYATNGVETVTENEAWLSPAESIDKTICRTPAIDGDGDPIEGKWDIAFRVRMGKGSKACRIPEQDFKSFVELLSSASESVPEACAQVEKLRAKEEAKAAALAAKAAAKVSKLNSSR
jgi:hypothetical protein